MYGGKLITEIISTADKITQAWKLLLLHEFRNYKNQI